jgi:hypothetical protein
MQILRHRRIQIRAQFINVDHSGSREDRQDFILRNGLAAPDRDHLGQRLAVERQRIGMALSQAARDGSRVSDELPDADIARLGAWMRHDGSMTHPRHAAPRRTTGCAEVINAVVDAAISAKLRRSLYKQFVENT